MLLLRKNTLNHADRCLFHQVGSTCSSNSSCTTGQWSQQTCVDVKKRCASDCNGRGTCQYLNVQTNQVQGSCASLSSACVAQCACKAGNNGYDCSLNIGMFNQIKAFRSSLRVSLLESLTFQDMSLTSMNARFTAVAEILLDVSQINDLGLVPCILSIIVVYYQIWIHIARFRFTSCCNSMDSLPCCACCYSSQDATEDIGWADMT